MPFGGVSGVDLKLLMVIFVFMYLCIYFCYSFLFCAFVSLLHHCCSTAVAVVGDLDFGVFNALCHLVDFLVWTSNC